MPMCAASLFALSVYLKAVDSQGHIKAFIVRCGWQPMGVYMKIPAVAGSRIFIFCCGQLQPIIMVCHGSYFTGGGTIITGIFAPLIILLARLLKELALDRMDLCDPMTMRSYFSSLEVCKIVSTKLPSLITMFSTAYLHSSC